MRNLEPHKVQKTSEPEDGEDVSQHADLWTCHGRYTHERTHCSYDYLHRTNPTKHFSGSTTIFSRLWSEGERERGRRDMKERGRHVGGCPRIMKGRVKIHCIKRLKFKVEEKKVSSTFIVFWNYFLIYMTSIPKQWNILSCFTNFFLLLKKLMKARIVVHAFNSSILKEKGRWSL